MSSEENDSETECASLSSTFSSTFKSVQEIKYSKDAYILHIAPKFGVFAGNVAAAFSDGNVDLLTVSNERVSKFESFNTSDGIVGTDFSNDNANLLFVACKKGRVKVYDVRTCKLVKEFKDTLSTSYTQHLTCLAISPSSALLCAGTELKNDDSFILFWDIRKEKSLGGYWESHKDDITQVRFNPDDSNKLASSSTDGLINIFDISQTSEEDAFIDSCNTGSSVDDILWYKERKHDFICCTTHTSDVHLWNTDDADFKVYNRSYISNMSSVKSRHHCYLSSPFKNVSGEIFILVNSTHHQDQQARVLKVNKNKLEPAYVLTDNQQIIRCSWTNPEGNLLLTGGESGILNTWEIK